MKELKENLQILAIVFATGFFFGIVFYTFVLKRPPRPHSEVCKLDIAQVKSLKIQLTDSNNLCLQKIDAAVKIESKTNKETFQKKYKRLEEACNELDCLQCKRDKKK
jgi:uncharacterized protein YktB (UPF0637 family)